MEISASTKYLLDLNSERHGEEDEMHAQLGGLQQETFSNTEGSSRGRERVVNGSETLFAEEKIKEMVGYAKGSDYIEVRCGCTSKRYGDTTATLRVHANGQFLLFCDCTSACVQKNVTPHEFEKHSDKEGRRRWQSNIWVLMKNKKVPLWRTPLFKYYNHLANGASGTVKKKFHRDEFITCFRCNKQRRFRPRSNDQCRSYHDALLNKAWKCADHPYNKISCENKEERASRKKARGCPRTGSCKGCTSCVCVGCLMCRFVDCSCRTCVDFMQNAEP
ncbi:protein ULTRAPETALA 2-like [Euphorbia lathyris]|uniref:protein ULTRAPETALA 2-like n=1 Tax=Euphorbia lathyris TaxID=212925 RepID=UPI003313C17B